LRCRAAYHILRGGIVKRFLQIISTGESVLDGRHEKARRKHNLPARIAGAGDVPITAKIAYPYSRFGDSEAEPQAQEP
jgi:hypothetical protein